jgi:cysteine desulfurase / selenocysteine lyase
VDDITPDLIARLATRIYNETSPSNGAAAPEPPSMPDFPASPASIPSHLGSLPFSIGSLPMASSVPRTLDGSTPPDSMESPNVGDALPFATHAPEFPVRSVFGTESASEAKSPDGLGEFIRKIRQMSLSNGDAGLDDFGRQFPMSSFTAAARSTSDARPLDVPAIREDFPALRQRVHGKPLAWLDNAATTQKPQSVIDALSRFYEQDYSNIHRGAHTLAARATDAYEKAREKVQSFLGASSANEIIFVRGTTEGINLVTQTYGRKFLQSGDEIVLSILEHHANIVPWQMIAREKGAVLRVIPVNDRGEIMLEEYQKLLGPRTKVVALTQASNSLGTILPVAEMTQMAKRYGARVLIDGAQSVAHIPVNVQQLGADFFVFSGHKIFGPTGIGAVYIKNELHDVLPPWHGGGNMIRDVTFEETSYADPPQRFEAGTPSIADAVGLGAALEYVNRLGLANIAAYEHQLLEYATQGLCKIKGLRLIGTAREKVGVLSFVLPNRRTEEIGRLLDQEGIAVRAGHHCSQPSLRRFGVESTVRPSLAFYNTTAEIDRLIDAVKRIQLLPSR